MGFNDHAFVARLSRVVPSDVRLAYRAGALRVAVGNKAPSVVDVSASLRIGECASAAWTLLNAVQDELGVSAGRPWPVGRHDLALPQVTVSNGRLRAWYGTDGEVVVDVGEFAV